MKEAFEKIVERLEKYQKEYKSGMGYVTDELVFRVMENVIYIVKEVAEEYGKDTNVTTKDCSKCSRRSWYQIGYADAEKNNGWIPCSERLPETDGKYIVCTTKGSVYCTKYYSRAKDFGTDMNTHIEAWQPLPAPYQSREV